jgi:hypothetical protein
MKCAKCEAPYKPTVHTIGGAKVNGYTSTDGAKVTWTCAQCRAKEIYQCG